MFIRDLEHYQLEASNNQFDLVNGGMLDYGYGYGKEPKRKASFPTIALSKVSINAVTLGTKAAITFLDLGSANSAGPGSAAVLTGLEMFSLAVGG